MSLEEGAAQESCMPEGSYVFRQQCFYRSTVVRTAQLSEQHSCLNRIGRCSGNGLGLLSEKSASQHPDQGLVSFVVLDRQASLLDCCFEMLWAEEHGGWLLQLRFIGDSFKHSAATAA